MKKLLLLSVVVASLGLTGCATRTGTALVAGTAGVLIGSSIANAHQPRTVVVRETARTEVVVIAEQCQKYALHTAERAACDRGARQRYQEELRRRENEAYKDGLGR